MEDSAVLGLGAALVNNISFGAQRRRLPTVPQRMAPRKLGLAAKFKLDTVDGGEYRDIIVKEQEV